MKKMVEKIIINPQKIRGLGNIVSKKTEDDFTLSGCNIDEGTDTVNGVSSTVFSLESNSVHDYSIAFGSSTYNAIAGSCTVTVTLLDDGVAVSGATISVTGSDSSLYTGITNSSGIASITLRNISSTTTFTASFSGVSATCTVSTITYFFNDDASSDNTSNYGNSTALRNNGTNTFTWDSNGYYVLTNTKANSESMRSITPLTGKTSFTLEFDAYCTATNYGSTGFIIYKDSNNWEKLSDDCNTNKDIWEAYNRNGTFTETRRSYTSAYGQVTNNKWMHHKYTISGTTFRVVITDPNDVTVIDNSYTIPSSVLTSATQFGLDCEWGSGTSTRYKNIIAY